MHTPPNGSLKQALSAEQLALICARVFGPAHVVDAVDEVPGGTINTVYRLQCRGRPPLVLRVAPPDDHPALFRHEQQLLRREFAVQPFLAPLGRLLPDIVFVDFTQQLLARDFLVQTWIAGDVWNDVRATLPPAEQSVLWQQLGMLTRQIHMVHQDEFGPPLTAPGFDRWSDALLADVATALLDFATWQLPTVALETMQAFVVDQRPLFDFLPTARLLHGDLWLNNLLVQRTADGLQIVGVLDAGFAEWGDPAADWTLMRLALTPLSGSDAFWEGYGPSDAGPNATLRGNVYRARMLAWAALELTRGQHPDAPQLLHQLATLSDELRVPHRQ